MPLFIKTHSYGEYVFDWSWADAYRRHGLHYYPKLVSAIPFTPATGPRWGIKASLNNKHLLTFMGAAIIAEAKKLNASSYHCLFTTEKQSRELEPLWHQRIGYQYHWFNEGYSDFDDFLSTMTSRKRKNILKERKKIQQQNISIVIKCGDDIQDLDWQTFFAFYQTTYIKRSGHTGYLSDAFFPLLAKKMSEHLVMIQATIQENNHTVIVAAALCFKDSSTLYGRYWGCREDYDSLHFEACYYQGIEYAIQQGLQRFDPGAQGEHKIQRGFTPIKTYSNHWIANDNFREAIEKFLVVEEKEVEQYLVEARQLLPFKDQTSH